MRSDGELPQSMTDVAVFAYPVFAYPGETLRTVAERMASARVTEMPVVEAGTGKIAAVISLEDMLHARVRSYDREMKQERVRRLRMPFARPRAEAPEENYESVSGA
jgi:CBS domain-containing protein